MTATIEVNNLTLAYRWEGKVRPVVHQVGFEVPRGTALGLIGESGSGKSTIASAIIGFLSPNAVVQSGTVRIDGEDILAASPKRLRALHGRKLGLVAQNAQAALNPSMRIGRQLAEAIRANPLPGDSIRQQAIAMLEKVHLPDPQNTLRKYPHELSGGQQQRAFIAMALAASPEIIVFDEPTTGLDASIEAEILDLIEEIRAEVGITSVFISHNLGLVGRLCDQVAVLSEGHLVESGPTDEVLSRPRHPYTRALLDCLPRPDSRKEAGRANRMDGLLRVSQVSKRYGKSPVLRDVSFTINSGEVVGVVGESGSGKTTLARIIAGLASSDAGSITLDGKPLGQQLSRRDHQDREAIQMVYQDPEGTLNPRLLVGSALARAIKKLGGSAGVDDLLGQVSLPVDVARRLPGALSGGQRQRVAIARSLAGHPKLLLADEPVSALDISVQAEILALLAALQTEQNLSMLFISHDINVVRYLADRVIVLFDGEIVEQGPVEEVLSAPQHPYTQRLLKAARATELPVLSGLP